MSYLRNGWTVNLRATENCIFSIRSIERNMRPILRTVQFLRISKVSLLQPAHYNKPLVENRHPLVFALLAHVVLVIFCKAKKTA
jgi:hypothetical protein